MITREFDANDIAWLAADRAMQTALAIDDTVALIGMTDRIRPELVTALVRLHEGGRALEYAQRIDPILIGTLTPERKASYLLDLAQAHTRIGHYDDATRTLAQAERVAPEEVRCRPLAHRLLQSLLETTSGDFSRILRQMAARAGLPA